LEHRGRIVPRKQIRIQVFLVGRNAPSTDALKHKRKEAEKSVRKRFRQE